MRFLQAVDIAAGIEATITMAKDVAVVAVAQDSIAAVVDTKVVGAAVAAIAADAEEQSRRRSERESVGFVEEKLLLFDIDFLRMRSIRGFAYFEVRCIEKL